MRRLIVTLVLAVGLGAVVSCTPAPGSPAPIFFQSNWNPLTEREEGVVAACSIINNMPVHVASGSEVYVQVTLPGNVLEEGWTQRVDQNSPYSFVSEGRVDAGECFSVLLIDTLGNGQFTYWPVFGPG